MPGHAELRVEPSELDQAATKVEAIATSLGHSLAELAGVQHAQSAADNPEVAAAMVALVDAWGSELANVTAFVSTMADKLLQAGSCYVSTDQAAGNWAETLMGGVTGGASSAIRPIHHYGPR
jgi:uncharacterized protein YukE